MQLASSGARALQGHASHLIRGARTRAIHIPAPAPPPTATQRLLSNTRTLLSRFVAPLTAPGAFSAPTHSHAYAYARTGLANAARAPTIQQGFSLPMRHALAHSRPMYLPRGPPAAPRGIAQVGLGAARNFTTGRPIFQQLAQNVPVAGRAVSQAGWDIDERLGKEQRRARMRGEGKKGKTEGMMKPKAQKIKVSFADAVQEPTAEQEELDRYFPQPLQPAVSASLLVPLAPTPSEHTPLPRDLPAAGGLLPARALSALASVHADHGTHALRVSALFARLEAAHVWERGARSAAYGAPGGACVVLRVVFDGWTAAEVRGVIGESGTGWCALEEVREAEEDGLSDVEIGTPPATDATAAPTSSFVMPTLDFSSSFMDANDTCFAEAFPAWTGPPAASTLEVGDWSDAGNHTDADAMSDGSLLDDDLSDVGSEQSSWGRVSFSSRFEERMEHKEYLF